MQQLEEPISIQLDLDQLQNPLSQDLMLTFLHYGEQQLAIKEAIAGAYHSALNFKKEKGLVFSRILRRIQSSFDAFCENIEGLQKLLVERLAFENSLEIINICDEFVKVIDDLIKIIDQESLAKLDQILNKISILKKSLEEKPVKIPYSNFTNIKPTKVYTIYLNAQAYQVVIPNYSLLLRHRAEGKKGVVYEVLETNSDNVGKGIFASVKKLVGKVKNDFRKVSFKRYGIDTVAEYVLKNSDKKKYKEDLDIAIAETRILKHTAYMHSKEPIISKKRCRIVMQYLPNVDLYTLLESDGTVLSPYFLIDSALKLTKAYQLQIYNNGIIHRDIKAENVRLEVNQHTGQPVETINQAKFFDFNLSQLQTDSTTGIKGTLFYLAPEILQGLPASSASDIYALAIILMEIIQKLHPDPSSARKFEDKLYIFSECIVVNPKKSRALIDDLLLLAEKMLNSLKFPTGIPEKIILLIRQMLSEDPNQRPSIQELLLEFEKIKSGFLKYEEYIDNKVTLTQKILDSIEKKSCEDEVTLEQGADNSSSADTNNILNIPQAQDEHSVDPLEHLRNAILSGCFGLNGDYLKQFLDKLGIKVLYNLQSTKEVENKIDAVINDFKDTMQTIFSLYEQLEILEVDATKTLKNFDLSTTYALMTELDEVIDKHKKYPLTLDNLVELTSRIKKRLAGLTGEVEDTRKCYELQKKAHTFQIEIEGAIEKYELESNVGLNQFFHRRAFSAQRIADIKILRGAFTEGKNFTELFREIQLATQKISPGMFPHSKSRLQENLRTVLASYDKPSKKSVHFHPVIKSPTP